MQPEDAIVFCTDGLTDAFDHNDEQFGIERLQTLCEREWAAAPQGFLSRVFAAIERFSHGREQHDDMAAALFHFCG